MIKNFTVGPSKLYHGVADFICQSVQSNIGEISHRSADFTEMSKNTMKAFRSFFKIPEDYRVYYTYSATEGMEIITRSAVDQKACHITNGNFGETWAKTSKKAQKQVQKISHGGEKRVELSEITPDADAELLAITANETATGIAYSPEEITEIRSKNPEILLGVDVTSSMGAVAYDFTQADAWFFSVQKCFGMPAGLGLLVVGPRLWEKTQEREARGEDVGCHHSLSGLEKKMPQKIQTPTTPNVLNIGTLGFVCEQFKQDFGTIENLYAKTQEKAAKFYEFFENHPKFSPAVESGRSESVIVANGSEEYLAALHTKLAEKDIVVGKGYGPAKTKQIRIANFPVSTIKDVENLLGNF